MTERSNVYAFLVTKKDQYIMYQSCYAILVREMRIELTQESLYAPQTYASTSSATRASPNILSKKEELLNRNFRKMNILRFETFNLKD